MCSPSTSEVAASSEGRIISPTLTTDQAVDCYLELTGIPENSWFGLQANTLNLPCVQQYSCWGTWCKTGESFLQVDQLGVKLCQPAPTYIYHYKNYAGSLKVRLYSDNYRAEIYRFMLTYTGETVGNFTILYYIILYYIVLCCFIFYCFMLYYIIILLIFIMLR